MALPQAQIPPRGERLYEGKAKVVYATADPGLVRIYFKDDATAFDGRKRGTIGEKGRLNARIAAHLFRVVEAGGVPTHLVAVAGEQELLARRGAIVVYEVTAEAGPPHERVFDVAAIVEGHVVAQGSGRSKKEAEQAAAAAALEAEVEA